MATALEKLSEFSFYQACADNGFPDVVLFSLFCYLSIQDLSKASCVCKYWNTLIKNSDALWKKFLPHFNGFRFTPTKVKTTYEAVKEIWQNSVLIGKEIWYPNPLPDLKRFDERLRKAEYHHFYGCNSTTVLMLRLNPCYEFTTKGKEQSDTTMREMCEKIWEKFGGKDEDSCRLKVTSVEEVMKLACYIQRKEALMQVIDAFQPYWFLEVLMIDGYNLDENGNIVYEQGEESAQEGNDIPEEELGDISQSTADRPISILGSFFRSTQSSAAASIFGPFDNRTLWKNKVNKPLSKGVYKKLKALFADRSEHFIQYNLSDGCDNENFQYGHYMLISDTAVFYNKQFYDL